MKLRVVFPLLFVSLCALSCPRLHAQDPEQLLQQLTALQQQLSETGDPCPLMPRFRQLISQFANQSPDMYQAMKPSLDLLNSTGDGCSADATAQAAAAPSPAVQGTIVASAPPPPGSMASQFAGQPGVTHTCHDMPGGQTATCMYYKNGVGIGSELACPTSGMITLGTGGPGHLTSHQTYPCTPGTPASQIGNTAICFSGMQQTGDVAVGIPCTQGQPTTPGSGFQSISPVFNCVTPSYVNDDLTFTNNCNVPLYVTWWIGGHSGSWTIDPNASNGTGYTSADVAAGGGDTFYVCPKGDSPVDGSGHVLTGSASNYTCRAF